MAPCHLASKTRLCSDTHAELVNPCTEPRSCVRPRVGAVSGCARHRPPLMVLVDGLGLG